VEVRGMGDGKVLGAPRRWKNLCLIVSVLHHSGKRCKSTEGGGAGSSSAEGNRGGLRRRAGINFAKERDSKKSGERGSWKFMTARKNKRI